MSNFRKENKTTWKEKVQMAGIALFFLTLFLGSLIPLVGYFWGMEIVKLSLCFVPPLLILAIILSLIGSCEDD